MVTLLFNLQEILTIDKNFRLEILQNVNTYLVVMQIDMTLHSNLFQ